MTANLGSVSPYGEGSEDLGLGSTSVSVVDQEGNPIDMSSLSFEFQVGILSRKELDFFAIVAKLCLARR